MMSLRFPRSQMAGFTRRTKQVIDVADKGNRRAVQYTAKDGVRQLISSTPMASKKTRKVWNKWRTAVVTLKIAIATPGRAYAKAGWAAGAAALRISTKFGRPRAGSAKVKLRTRSPRVEVTNAVPYAAALNDGGIAPPVPTNPKPHSVPRADMLGKAERRAKRSMDRNLKRTARDIERAWGR